MVDQFHAACETGNLKLVGRILASDPQAIERESDNYFPIQRAIPKHPDAVRYLLQAGDDPNRQISSVHWFEWEDAAIGQGLAAWRPIHMVALHGYHENSVACAEVLSEFGADLNPMSPMQGRRSLHLAATPNWTRVIDFLISSGVNVDVETVDATPTVDWNELMNMSFFEPFDGQANTALMIAAGEGFREAIDCLIGHGANVNARNSNGFTPLHFAAGAFWAKRENIENVRLLLDKGALKGAEDNCGRRPVDLARTKGYQDIVALLGD